MQRIPLILISGFLGSGKTTLLLRLLQEAKLRDLNVGILMNELGQQDVDGVILREEAGFSVEKLLDGCVCCSKKEELADSLEILIRKRPDLIVAELTGVANPVEIVSLLSSPAFIRSIQTKHILTVLDAEHGLEYGSRLSSDKQLVGTLQDQIKAASLILLNKADLVSTARLAKLEKMVRKYNDRAPVLVTEQASLDIGHLLDQTLPQRPRSGPSTIRLPGSAPLKREAAAVSRGGDASHPEQADLSFSKVETFTLPCPPGSKMSKQQVEQFLLGVSGELLRSKGYLNIDGEGTFLLQYSGGRFVWQRSAYPGAGYLVLIGMEMDRQHAVRHWESLFSAKPDLNLTP